MTTAQATRRRHGTWRRILGSGLLLWVLAAFVTAITANPLLVPTLVMLGSFLVPVTFVAWAFERRRSDQVTTELLFRTFVVGGVLGVLAASVAESYLLQPSPWMFFGVGLLEEAAKLGALAYCTRHLSVRSAQDGAILGATVGLGFAAFESAGYALVASLTVHGLSLTDLVETELLRGLLSPFGHGVWTAILGAVLFSTAGRSGFRVTGRLVGAYLGVSILHGLWDSMDSIAVTVTYLLTGQTWRYRLLDEGYLPEPTAIQVQFFTILSWTGLLVIAVTGVVFLVLLLRRRAAEHG
ncbi:PrsW family intramembrane metalloprotease [Actinomycetospora sp. TBRC 11914]|uniref:PrsW family intramembrane metalloprotease n=1 Tax=Actinomycetospora sp. TBRC 11914 TaxID=2729387 RepID=UPI00145DBBCA|nr:PrsW family glutamic-type intramembrane protease [Actinomycetospora sp. TBRC 11914]NMO92809.1 PrsW family intramembrane metalloprotease [Actinomycetospora sp. TBRC 11914]